MLALLASALLPGLAAAECSGGAGCINYQGSSEVPSLEGTVKPAHPKKHHQSEETGPGAEVSTTPDPGTSEADGKNGESEEEKATGGGGTNGDHGGTNGSQGGNNGQGGNKHGGGNKSGSQTGGGPTVTPIEKSPSSNASSGSSSSGGSSVLVWIIIAVVILAAISIGAFVIRQRRQGHEGGSGSQVSPKAS